MLAKEDVYTHLCRPSKGVDDTIPGGTSSILPKNMIANLRI